MAHCDIYSDVAITDQAEDGLVWHYARTVFNWDAPRFELAYNCAWDGPWDLYPYEGLAAVYVIAPVNDTGFCKIGITDNPVNRLSTIQTSHWVDLKIHSILWVWGNNARVVEKASHNEAKARSLEMRGEWVKSTTYGALDLVLDVAARLGVEAGGNESVRMTFADDQAGRAHAYRSQTKANDAANAILKAQRQGYELDKVVSFVDGRARVRRKV